ncbi:MAG: NACHT domain-containing protein [Algicola sp.]|nr:NACHT domain-containing protein [Algicola sp.]
MESTEIILSLTRSFREPLILMFSNIKEEILYLINDPLPEYLQSMKNKFGQTKTFLFRDEQVDFEKTYFPITLSHNKKQYQIKSVESFYQNNNYTTIIGNAGSGKSMQMKFLFLKCIEQRVKIPIFIELKSLNDYKGSIIDYVYEIILSNKISPSSNLMERILTSGDFYFLFDGYDEVYSARKDEITHDLELFIDRYSKNWYAITSRPGSGIESFPRFENNYVQALSDDEIELFIEVQCKIINDIELSSKIKSTIKSEENKSYRGYLSSPLLLSMFLFTFRTHPQLPKRKSKFYWNVFDTLISRHDSFTKKGGWQHERLTNLQDDEVESILKWFSYLTYFEEVYSFDSETVHSTVARIKGAQKMDFNTNDFIYDITVNLGLFHKDGLEYKFPHRTLQEYFAAKLISEQKDVSKKKVYIKKFNYRDSIVVFGSRDNFYDLCLELDEISFKEFALVHHLKVVRKKLYSTGFNKIIENFFEFFGYQYVLKEYDGVNLVEGRVVNASYEIDVLSFLNLVNRFEVGDEVVFKGIKDIDIQAVKTHHTVGSVGSVVFDALSNKEVFFPILRKYGFVETIHELIKSIDAKIKELEDDIQLLKNANHDLLDF